MNQTTGAAGAWIDFAVLYSPYYLCIPENPKFLHFFGFSLFLFGWIIFIFSFRFCFCNSFLSDHSPSWSFHKIVNCFQYFIRSWNDIILISRYVNQFGFASFAICHIYFTSPYLYFLQSIFYHVSLFTKMHYSKQFFIILLTISHCVVYTCIIRTADGLKPEALRPEHWQLNTSPRQHSTLTH